MAYFQSKTSGWQLVTEGYAHIALKQKIMMVAAGHI